MIAPPAGDGGTLIVNDLNALADHFDFTLNYKGTCRVHHGFRE
jgi:hypothetical protein